MKSIRCNCSLRAKLNHASKLLKKKKIAKNNIEKIYSSDFIKKIDIIKEFPIRNCPNTDEFCEKFLTPNMGFGVRAKVFIPRNTFIGCYIGELTNNKSCNENWKYAYSYIFKEFYIDGSTFDSITSFFNHSDKPNVTDRFELHNTDEYEEIHISFYTTQDVDIGEELFIDYGDDYWTYALKQGILKDTKQKLITDYFQVLF